MRYNKTEYVLFDLEALHNGKQDDFMEIVEIAAYKVTFNGKIEEGNYSVIDTFQTYIKPVFHTHISKKLSKIIHFTMDDLKAAPSYDEAINSFYAWAGDATFVSWSQSDKDMIYKNNRKHYVFDLPIVNFIDLQKEYDMWKHKKKRTGLTTALEDMGYTFEGSQHNALTDSFNMLPIMKEVLRVKGSKFNFSHI